MRWAVRIWLQSAGAKDALPALAAAFGDSAKTVAIRRPPWRVESAGKVLAEGGALTVRRPARELTAALLGSLLFHVQPDPAHCLELEMRSGPPPGWDSLLGPAQTIGGFRWAEFVRVEDPPGGESACLVFRRSSRSFTLKNMYGLHARTSALVVKTCSAFQSTVTLECGGHSWNAKSMLDVLSCEGTRGTAFTAHAVGPDAAEALDALQDIVDRNFFEVD